MKSYISEVVLERLIAENRDAGLGWSELAEVPIKPL
jgi:hypothetical protein